MSDFALWRRLDTPGHDAALLSRRGSGWELSGAAIFKHKDGPAHINYLVDVDASWRTERARVQGSLAGRSLDHSINRQADGWYLDGALIRGLEHLRDIDYGFTPATNLLQMRGAVMAQGQAVDLPVAWFDLDGATLTELPQRYERLGETTYRYEAPTVPYQGLLEMSQNGFVKTYPQLWQTEI
jgi:hypothetical protein